MVAAAHVVSPLGRPVAIAALSALGAVYVRKGSSPGTFCFFVENEQLDLVSCDVHVKDGRVLVLGASPGLLNYFGGGTLGRAGLQAALQAAVKAPAKPKAERVVRLPVLGWARIRKGSNGFVLVTHLEGFGELVSDFAVSEGKVELVQADPAHLVKHGGLRKGVAGLRNELQAALRTR